MSSGAAPRHRKSRLGCERCKARKVKCDEVHPRCGQCARHRVECIYAPHPTTTQAPRNDAPNPRVTATIPAILDDSPMSTSSPDNSASSSGTTHTPIELRMLHWFVAKTSETLSASLNLWKIRAPLVAFDRPPVFDVLVALATLHVIREKQYGPPASNPRSWGQFMGGDSFLDSQSVDQLRVIAEHYFQRGLQSHRAAMDEASSIKDYEGIFIGTVLIAIYALFMLGDVETASADYDETVWFKLSMGTREIGARFMQIAGKHVILELGVDDDEPNVIEDLELENPQHAEIMRPLKDFGREFEIITPEDDEVYQEVLIYIGLMYHNAFTQSESPRATCRRLFALPSKLPPRFRDLVFEQRPRALAVLLLAFAIGKFIENDLVLMKGIARNQIPAIHARLPSAWKEFLGWPLDVLNADTADKEAWPEIYFGQK